MFAYCDNSPIIFCDSQGTSKEFTQKQLEYGGNAGAIGGVSLLGAFIYVGDDLLTSLANSFSSWFSGLLQGIEEYAERKRQEQANKPYQYWEASLVNKTVVVGRGISVYEAAIRVSMGLNVMCANAGAANRIIAINGYRNAVGPEIHGDNGYYWHYHPNRHSHVHIWYY